MLKKVDDRFNYAIATAIYEGGVSVQKARVAIKVICEKLYDHIYWLEPNDILPEECSPLSKKPRSEADYERYTDILPSKKATSTYKNKKAFHQEIRAANLLMNKKDDVEVTMHYDTTSRSKIDGDWPSIISNFMSDKDECAMVTF